MDIYNSQTSAVVSREQKSPVSGDSTSDQHPKPLVPIHVGKINTRFNRGVSSGSYSENSDIAPEEERNYYKKTLKGRLI